MVAAVRCSWGRVTAGRVTGYREAWWTRPLSYTAVGRGKSVPTQTTISVREDEQGRIVVTDTATGIEAAGENRPIALQTLAEKLEVEVLPESGRSRE